MKTCFKCGLERPLSEFYLARGMSDGHQGKCKDCAKADSLAHRIMNAEHFRSYDKDRAMYPHRVKARKQYLKTEAGRIARANAQRNYYSRHAEKRAAQIAVGNAVRDGRLIKGPCETCGAKKVEAHHGDYSKPLEVRWLCNKHHRAQHSVAA